jgi:transcription elongation factor GreA
MDKKYLMTRTGYAKLVAEINNLIKVERPRVIDAIKESRAYGGELSENSEYLEAKDQQEGLEKKISELQLRLDNARVIDIENVVNDGVVRFGTIVKLLDLDTDEEFSYQIVGQEESSIKEGRISYLSPIATAMMNKKIGDLIYFRIPNGERELEILEIKTPK